MSVGDLVRPKTHKFRDQIGVVIAVGLMGGVSVRLMCGRISTYNRGALVVVSEK